jgi:hypothetical protein
MYAWEAAFADKISDVRKEELKHLRKTLWYEAANAALVFMIPAVIFVVVMVVYSVLGNEMSTQTTFGTLAWINAMRFPLIMLPHCISASSQGLVSLRRLARFLALVGSASALVTVSCVLFCVAPWVVQVLM